MPPKPPEKVVSEMTKSKLLRALREERRTVLDECLFADVDSPANATGSVSR